MQYVQVSSERLNFFHSKASFCDGIQLLHRIVVCELSLLNKVHILLRNAQYMANIIVVVLDSSIQGILFPFFPSIYMCLESLQSIFSS